MHYECRFYAQGQGGKGAFETEIHLSAAAEEVQGQFSEAHSIIPWDTDKATRIRALTKPIDQLPSASLTANQAARPALATPLAAQQAPMQLPATIGSHPLALPPELAQLDLESTLDHVEYRDFSVPRNNGIGGAHNQTEWAKHSTDYTEISRMPNPDVPGVEQVKYQIPALDRERKPTGQLRAKVYDKSVYDPHIWPRPRLKKSLQEAIQDAYSKNGNSLAREWSGRTVEGYPVRGFYDAQNKKITTFFFEFLD